MIVLIGGSGRVGSAAVSALLSSADRMKNLTLRVVTRRPDEIELGSQAEVVEGDLDDRRSIERALDGADRLFLLSSAHPDMDKRETAVIRTAQALGIRYLLKVSGSDGLVGRHSRSLTMRQHYEVEQTLASSGLDWAILRPSAFVQTTMEQIAPFVRDSHRFSLPGGAHHFAFVDARDVAAVAAEILAGSAWWNRTHVLTGPEALSCSRIAEIISDVLGEKITYRPRPLFFARLAINQQIHYHHARDQAADLAALLAKGIDDRATDTVQRILGRPPRSVAQWVRENIDLFRR